MICFILFISFVIYSPFVFLFVYSALLDNTFENYSSSDPHINPVIHQNNGTYIATRNHTDPVDDSLKTKKIMYSFRNT